MATGHKMVFDWKDTARMSLDAQVAGERLERIRKKHKGRLTAEAVLADGRLKSSPFHDIFEWKDSVAAEAYRLDQARYIIRKIVIVREDCPDQVRAYHRVIQADDEKPTYTSIVAVMNSPNLRKQLIDEAERELLVWRKRYANLKKFAKVFAAIDALKK